MSAPQTSVSTQPDLGMLGSFADLKTASDGKVVSRFSEEASTSIPMGSQSTRGGSIGTLSSRGWSTGGMRATDGRLTSRRFTRPASSASRRTLPTA